MAKALLRRLAVPLLITFLLPALSAEAACLTAREARRAVAAGEALRLGAIARQVRGDIVDAQLCERGGRLVYRLTVLGQGGRLVTVVVDARSGDRLN